MKSVFVATVLLGFLLYPGNAAAQSVSAPAPDSAPIEKATRLKAEARAGNAEAAYQLGLLYLNGANGIAPNEKQAVSWLENAALSNHAKALLQLGYCASSGIGMLKNQRLAADYYQRSAALGFPAAQISYAQICAEGCPPDDARHLPMILPDPRKAEAILRPLVNARHPEAQCALAQLFAAHPELDTKKELFFLIEKAAAQRHPPAMRLFVEFKFMHNTPRSAQNESEIFALLNTPELVHDPATEVLRGRCYEFGIGTEPDSTRAADCYKRGSEQMEPQAMNAFARCLIEGIGVEKNPEVGLGLYTLGAKAGNIHAVYALGECLYKGVGTPTPDPQSAYPFFEAAAQAHYPPGLYSAATMLLSGQGVRRDPKKAVEYLTEAVQQGNPMAMLRLADCLEQGIGTKKDTEYAAFLRQKARRILRDQAE